MGEKASDVDLNSFAELAERAMFGYLHLHGSIIYTCPATTLTKDNPVLVYGINPGQDPNLQIHPSNPILGDSIDGFANQHDWRMQPQLNRGREYPGLSRYQRGVDQILQATGLRNSLVTNLYFLQSPNPGALDKGICRTSLLNACWKVHEEILRITQAKVIIAGGTETAQALKARLSDVRLISKQDSGHGGREGLDHGWACSHFEGKLGNGRSIQILHVPHLSYYRISKHREVRAWICKACERAGVTCVKAVLENPPHAPLHDHCTCGEPKGELGLAQNEQIRSMLSRGSLNRPSR